MNIHVHMKLFEYLVGCAFKTLKSACINVLFIIANIFYHQYFLLSWCLCVSICPFVHLSICQSVNLSILSISVYPCLCQSVSPCLRESMSNLKISKCKICQTKNMSDVSVSPYLAVTVSPCKVCVSP